VIDLVRGSIIAALAFVFLASLVYSQTPTLPQQIGSLNDYAATLGTQSRQEIQDKIDRLSTRGNLNVAVLISRLDPFSHPPTFADAIWSEWTLSDERTLLLVFVSEEDSWNFHWKSSIDVRSIIDEVALTEDFQRVSTLVKDRRISDAVVQAISILDTNFVAPEIIEAPVETQLVEDPETLPDEVLIEEDYPISSENISLTQTQSGTQSNTLLYVIGGLIAALLLFLLVRLGLSGLCPDCGARLQKRTDPFSRPQFHRRSSRRGFGKQVYYACPNCRYQRAE
jgi:hypothetical protein